MSETPIAGSDPDPGPAAEAALAGRLIRGGWVAAAGSWWSIGYGFAVTIVLARLLPVEAFGAFALAYYVAGLVMLQPKIAAGAAFARHRDDGGESLYTYLVTEVALAAGSLVPAAVALALLPASLRGLFVALVLAGVVQGLANPLIVVREKQLDFSRVARLQVVAVTVSYLPAIWLAVRGAGAWSLVAQSILAATITLAGALWLTRADLARVAASDRRFEPRTARSFAAFGVTVGATAFLAAQATTLDAFLVGALLGTTVLGYYGRGSRTAQWPGLLLTAAIGRTALYAYARLDGDRPRLARAVTLTGWFIGVTAFSLAAAAFVTAPDLILVLFGERWVASAVYLRVLIVASALRPVWENMSTLFRGIGKPGVATVIAAAQVAALVVFGVPLTLWLGAVGAGLAGSAAMALGVLLIDARLRRELRVSLVAALGPPLLAAAGATAATLALVRTGALAGLPPAARVAVEGGIVAVAFAASIAVLQPATARERLAAVWRLARAR
jgi:teichuronic acid exporter